MRKLTSLFAFCVVSSAVANAQITCDFTFANTGPLCTPYFVNAHANETSGFPVTQRTWTATFESSPAGTGNSSSFVAFVDSCGTYCLTLHSTNSNGDTCSVTKCRTIACSPVVDFSFTNTTGCMGLCVQAQCNSQPGNGTINSVLIDWGCGPITNLSNCPSTAITYCYSNCSPRSYSPVVVVGNSSGCISSRTYTNAITIVPSPVVANFTAADTFSCSTPHTTTITATPCAGCVYTWSNGGACTNPAVVVNSTSNTETVTFACYGNFTINLTVTDAQGCRSSFSRPDYIQVRQINPRMSILNDVAGCAPVCPTFEFNRLLNPFPDSINSVCWSFPGSTVPGGCKDTIQRCFTTPGCYDVKLVVGTNTGCLDSITYNDTICVGSPPVCTLTASDDTMCFEEGPVWFTVGGDTFDFAWVDFCDGETAIVHTNPFGHFYQDTGCFCATIIPYRDSCAGNTVTVSNICIQPPVARFDDSSSCFTRDTVFLRNTSIGATSFKWYFCNGDSSTVAEPFIVLPPCDTCRVTLESYNSVNGCPHVTSRLVKACAEASMTPTNVAGCVNKNSHRMMVVFQNTSQFPSAPGYPRWDPDTVAGGLNFAFAGVQTFAWPNYSAGNYVAAMVNVTTGGCRDTAYAHVLACEVEVDFSTNNACLPNPMCFTSAITDSFCTVDSIRWNFGDGTPLLYGVANPCHTYSQSGIYHVQLYAKNNLGCWDTMGHDVIITHPVIIDYDIDTTVCPGSLQCITNNTSGVLLTYNWDIPSDYPYDTFAFEPCFTFDIAGDYWINVTVSSSGFCSTRDSVLIHVCPPVASGSVSNDTILCPNPPQLITFMSTSLCADSIWWSFGDGLTGQGDTLVHYYTFPGVYPVCLFAATTDGCVDSVCIDTIVVSGPQIGTFSITPVSACACEDTVHVSLGTVNANSATFIYGCGMGFGGVNPINPIGTPQNPTFIDFDVAYCLRDSCQIQVILAATGGCQVRYNFTAYIDSADADFTYNSTGVCDSGIVCFNDNTHYALPQSHSVSWHWNFGDGGTDTTENPCHYYSAGGTYTVSLVVEVDNGCTDSIAKQLTLHGPPQANFSSFVTDSCNAATICFTDLSSADPPGIITKRMWCFGDGACDSLSVNPCHSFMNEGVYKTVLFVEDENGCVAMDSFDIVSSIQHISANAGVVSISDSCEFVIACFTDSSSSETPVIQSIWDIDGMVYNTAQPCHRFYTSGVQDIVLQTTNSSGCSSVDTFELNVIVSNPLNASFTYTDLNNGTVHFVNTSTGLYTNVLWDFGFTTSTTNSPIIPFSSTGAFPVTLTIADIRGCTDDTMIIVTVIVSSVNLLPDEVDVKIIPNPFHDFTTIEINGTDESYYFRIVNVLGEEILNSRCQSGEAFRLYRGKLSPGLFLFEVRAREKLLKRGKIVVE